MIITVASGKGGTGKTLVATSLALSLREQQAVQLLDCDVEEPNSHIFLKPSFMRKDPVNILVPRISEEICTHCGKCAEVCAFHCLAVLKERVLVFPELCHGCGACSYLCPEKAITEEGREIGVVECGDAGGIDFAHGKLNVGEAMAPPVIRKTKEYTKPGKLVIIDAPPGTSCPVVESVRDSDFCLLVTEPTPFGLNDLALAVGMVRELRVPFGVLLNRAGIGDTSVEEYCKEERIPVLLKIPHDLEIAGLYSRGITLAEGMPSWREAFVELYEQIERLALEGVRK